VYATKSRNLQEFRQKIFEKDALIDPKMPYPVFMNLNNSLPDNKWCAIRAFTRVVPEVPDLTKKTQKIWEKISLFLNIVSF